MHHARATRKKAWEARRRLDSAEASALKLPVAELARRPADVDPCMATITLPGDGHCVACSRDLIACTAGDTTLLYSSSTGQSLGVLCTNSVCVASWDAEEGESGGTRGQTSLLATGMRGSKGGVIVWSTCVDPATAAVGKQKAFLQDPGLRSSREVWCCSFSEDGKRLAAGCGDTVQLFDISDLDSTQLVAKFEWHTGRKSYDRMVTSVAMVGRDGSHVFSSSIDMTVKLWRVRDKSLVATFKGHHHRVLSVSYSPSMRILVSSSTDHNVIVWEPSSALETEDGRKITTESVKLFDLTGHTSQVRACLVTDKIEGHGAGVVISVSDEPSIRTWDMAKRELRSIPGHAQRINSLAISPDGQRVLTCSNDGMLKVWDSKGLAPSLDRGSDPGQIRPGRSSGLVSLEPGTAVDWREGVALAPALFLAVNMGDSEAVLELLKSGADAKSQRPGDDGSPLLAAIQAGHTDVARVLIDHGADISAQGPGPSPLQVAAGHGFHELVELLLGSEGGWKEVQKRSEDPSGWTPLMSAANNGHEKVVRSLLDAGADVNAIAKDAGTAVQVAASRGHAGITRLLLDVGADPFRAKSGNGENQAAHRDALFFAVVHGHSDIVRYIFNARRDEITLNRVQNSLQDLSFNARMGDFSEVARALMSHLRSCANPCPRHPKYCITCRGKGVCFSLCQVSLRIAAERGHRLTVREILEGGVSKSAAVDCLFKVRRWGQNKKYDTYAYRTALMCAAFGGHKALVHDLVRDYKANVDARTKSGWTALMFGSLNGQVETVLELLHLGADPSLVNVKGKSALDLAEEKDNVETANLLRAPACSWERSTAAPSDPEPNMNVARKGGLTVLMQAAERGDAARVRRLHGDGAKVNVRNAFGWTALFYAAEGGHTEVIRELLDLKADTDKVSLLPTRRKMSWGVGITAFDVAREMGHSAVAEMLQSSSSSCPVEQISSGPSAGSNRESVSSSWEHPRHIFEGPSRSSLERRWADYDSDENIPNYYDLAGDEDSDSDSEAQLDMGGRAPSAGPPPLEAADDCIAEDDTAGEGIAEDDTAGEGIAEDDTAGEGIAEDDTAGEGIAEDDTAGEGIAEGGLQGATSPGAQVEEGLSTPPERGDSEGPPSQAEGAEGGPLLPSPPAGGAAPHAPRGRPRGNTAAPESGPAVEGAARVPRGRPRGRAAAADELEEVGEGREEAAQRRVIDDVAMAVRPAPPHAPPAAPPAPRGMATPTLIAAGN